VFSAWGMLMSDLRRDYFVTRLMTLNRANASRLGALLDEMAGSALEQFAREGIAAEQVTFRRYGNLRYENQEHSVEVPLPAGPTEFAGAHIVAIAEVGKLAPTALPTTGRRLGDALKGRRAVDYATEGIHEADIYAGELLDPGMSFDGPAIVETKGSSVVVHPG